MSEAANSKQMSPETAEALVALHTQNSLEKIQKNGLMEETRAAFGRRGPQPEAGLLRQAYAMHHQWGDKALQQQIDDTETGVIKGWVVASSKPLLQGFIKQAAKVDSTRPTKLQERIENDLFANTLKTPQTAHNFLTTQRDTALRNRFDQVHLPAKINEDEIVKEELFAHFSQLHAEPGQEPSPLRDRLGTFYFNVAQTMGDPEKAHDVIRSCFPKIVQPSTEQPIRNPDKQQVAVFIRTRGEKLGDAESDDYESVAKGFSLSTPSIPRATTKPAEPAPVTLLAQVMENHPGEIKIFALAMDNLRGLLEKDGMPPETIAVFMSEMVTGQTSAEEKLTMLKENQLALQQEEEASTIIELIRESHPGTKDRVMEKLLQNSGDGPNPSGG